MLRMLNDPEWSQWSDREIARKCSVTHPTVASYRQSIWKNLPDSPPATRKVERGGKVYEQDTTKIGRQTAPGKLRRDLDPMPEVQATNMPSSMHQVTPSRVEQFGWP